MRRVVITGLGAVSSVGVGVDLLMEALLHQHRRGPDQANTSHRSVPNDFGFVSHAIREVPDLGSHLDALPTEIRRQDPFAQFAAIAALEAIEDAQLTRETLYGPRSGLSLGTSLAGATTMENQFVDVTNSGADAVNPTLASQDLYQASLSNTPSVLLSALLGIQGPAYSISTGCLSGLDAIGTGFELIADNEVDIAVVGAADAPICRAVVASLEALSRLPSTPHQVAPASRFFNSRRNGFALAEGAGVLVLESAEYAERRGARAYAEIIGYAQAAPEIIDAPNTATEAPSLRVIQQAPERSGAGSRSVVDPKRAIGSGRPLRSAVGHHPATGLPAGSVKPTTGFALSASPVLEMISAAKTLRNGGQPPGRGAEHSTPNSWHDGAAGMWITNDGKHILQQKSELEGLQATIVFQEPQEGASSGN